MFINVMDAPYNAVGNGTTDDSAAINAAAAHLISLVAAQAGSGQNVCPATLYFPSGYKFLIGTSINLQSIQAYGWGIYGGGAIIIGACEGDAVFDCLGSAFGTFNNVTIIGDSTYKPAVGIQVGRITVNLNPAGGHNFLNTKMDGFFTRACIFNSAGEGNVWINPELHNQDDTGNAFCLMIDGLHHYDPLSHYIASRWAKDQPDSCIQHEIVNADFEIVRGTPLFLSNVNQFRASGYAATGQDEHFYPAVLFLAGSGLATFRDLEIDLHAEGFLTCNVRFEYNNVPPDVSSHPISIEGFHLHDFGSAATVALIEAGTNISELEIVSGDLFKGTGVLVPFTSGPCSISAGVRTNYQYQKIGPYAFTLVNESATSFEVPGTLSSAVLVLQSDGAGTECAMVWLRANASAAIQDIGSARGADVNLMIGALSGTTGALGKITVSANTDGRFYIENRIGSTRSFTVMLVGS